uniref:Uncharacterized protein n=1 Tax=Mycena chlorophos TaxID=658473 RepID=A0ABQ0L4P9_MYCCL|nr:predicted protein [Mycena chlorophos]
MVSPIFASFLPNQQLSSRSKCDGLAAAPAPRVSKISPNEPNSRAIQLDSPEEYSRHSDVNTSLLSLAKRALDQAFS